MKFIAIACGGFFKHQNIKIWIINYILVPNDDEKTAATLHDPPDLEQIDYLNKKILMMARC
jgi:hypothetical protein